VCALHVVTRSIHQRKSVVGIYSGIRLRRVKSGLAINVGNESSEGVHAARPYESHMCRI
jgi:hypothetical protein